MVSRFFKKCLLSIVGFTLLTHIANQNASAKLSERFGGHQLETIETADLANMLRNQQQATTEAKATGKEASPPNFVVVDVRSETEVNVSVIPGAITKAQFEKDRQQYQGRLVIAYCTVGVRSGVYAKQLKRSGFQVKNYQGSILQWVNAQLPLVTLDGKPTHRVHIYSNHYKTPAQYEQVTQ